MPVHAGTTPGLARAALTIALRDATASFADDLSRGTIGRHHNTYQHRTRILRQMAAELSGSRADATGSGT
ncbi:hypothetical protein BFL28_13155 [Sphingomonas turrisvirgatae]|uniref:Uncharacterized protein n=2 Tax=Sphingomonas turrisvirgatae TaxID=1888892 RepID=A0A1E3LYR5_9SPHN|nr:hypothetical protein BFL28_13155 [Sphingomonas turrisvirgatae]